ncbi:MAG: membrane protein insertase YidC [Clostridiaceae bacterium]
MSTFVSYLSSFFDIIQNFIYSFIPNLGVSYILAILVFTGIVRLILLPVNIKQTKSQFKMTEIQPEMKKIQDKYKNDKTKQQEETMKLYKEKGVSPFSSCLPLLIQMPILFSLFYVFRDLQGIEGVKFLWLTLDESDPAFILPIISGLTTYVSSKLAAAGSTGDQAKQTQMMNIGMSVFLVFMSSKFSTVLVFYWITNNTIQIIQTALMKKAMKKEKEAAV